MPIYAICPFYRYERKNLISCELGIMHFPTHKHKRTLSVRFCESYDWEKCKRAQRLIKQCEEEERMQYKRKQLRGIAPRTNKTKLNNEEIIIDGIKFQSKREGDRYCELKLLERAKKITDLELQKKYELIPAQYETVETGEHYKKGPKKGQPKTKKVCIEQSVCYTADFVYKENEETVVEDAKGYRDPSSAPYAKFVLKRKLMLWVHGIRVREV